MKREELLNQIAAYIPYNEQEAADRELILHWIQDHDDAFTRQNQVAHITASAWVVNRDRRKVLLVYHNIYNSWSWLGGHAEAGIANVRPVSPDIYSLESLTVDGHVKKGQYVSSHLHLNVTYLLEADSDEAVSIKEDENSGVAWFTPEEALAKSTEPWFVTHIYAKLIDKLKSSDL